MKENTTGKKKARKKRRPNPLKDKPPFAGFDAADGIGLIFAGIAILFPGLAEKIKAATTEPKCTHAEPVPCPVDASGAFTDDRCKHYGHVPGMCHACYCLRCTCLTAVGVHGGLPCPPDGNCPPRFDGCHRRDCLKDCPEALA